MNNSDFADMVILLGIVYAALVVVLCVTAGLVRLFEWAVFAVTGKHWKLEA